MKLFDNKNIINIKTVDFNRNHEVKDPEKKRLMESFKKVENIYALDLNKSPFLI